jgi:hypothetical protein
MGSTGQLNNRLESVFEYNVPYDNTVLSLSSHDTEVRRSNGKQLPGNSRGQPMSYQSVIEIHGNYSKNVVQEREDLRHRTAHKYQQYIHNKKTFIRQLQGLSGTNNKDEDVKIFDDLVAPLHSEEVFYAKTGNILFLAIPWGTRFPAEVKMPGASNVVVEDCFNGLTKYVRLIFWGVAAGESCAFRNDGREDFATHVFGTMTPCPNYGPQTLPIGVSVYMSGMGYTFESGEIGKVPVFAPHGQHPKKVVPFPFYLKDTNVYSIAEQVRFFVEGCTTKHERAFPGDPEKIQEAVLIDLLGFIVEGHLAAEVRTEIMIDDMVRLMGIAHLLRRSNIWFASDNPRAEDLELDRRITISLCQTAYRIAQGFLLKHERVATYYMNSVLQKDVRVEHEMLTKTYADAFPDNMSRSDLMKAKFWLESMVDHYMNVARSCFTQFLKDRWMGTTCNKTSPPNSSYDLLIRIGHPDVC